MRKPNLHLEETVVDSLHHGRRRVVPRHGARHGHTVDQDTCVSCGVTCATCPATCLASCPATCAATGVTCPAS